MMTLASKNAIVKVVIKPKHEIGMIGPSVVMYVEKENVLAVKPTRWVLDVVKYAMSAAHNLILS